MAGRALLSGMIQGGWTITGSWPIATEMGTRLRARDSAALATSVHLICRPRPEDAPIGDWADVLRELPKRVADWMYRLQGEGGARVPIWCSPASARPSKSTAATAPWKPLMVGEVALAEYLEKGFGKSSGARPCSKCSAPQKRTRDAALEGALEEDGPLDGVVLVDAAKHRGARRR